jgi:hypothetical protein
MCRRCSYAETAGAKALRWEQKGSSRAEVAKRRLETNED